MTSIDCIPLDSRADWDAAVGGVPHGFTHTWQHCRAMWLTSKLPTYLWRYQQDGVRVVCPFSERSVDGHTDVVTPPGTSGFTGTGECDGVPGAWARFAKERGYVSGYIGLNPLFTRALYHEGAESYNSIYVLDLRRSLDALLAGVDRNRRRELRSFGSSRERLVTDRERLIRFLLVNYPALEQRVGAAPAHRWSEPTLRLLCESPGSLVVGYEANHDIVAMHLFCSTPHAADAVLNVALPESRAYTSILVWFGVQFFKDQGVPLLNLGGGVREDDAVARSKQRFGAQRLPLRALKQIYDVELYDALCRRVGVDPRSSGYFPAYRRPICEGEPS